MPAPLIAATAVPAEAYLLDVREPQEWTAGHAPQAHHIPLGQLLARQGEIPAGQQVVAVCRSGGRSGQAAEYLATQGIDARNLDGGMAAWAQAGLAMVSETGAPPRVA